MKISHILTNRVPFVSVGTKKGEFIVNESHLEVKCIKSQKV